MKKIKFNEKLIIKIIAGTMSVVLVGSASGCKAKTGKNSFEILPQTKLEDLVDSISDNTIMDDYLESQTRVSLLDTFDNIQDLDIERFNKAVYEIGLAELKGAALDAIAYPLDIIKDVKFKTPEYTLEITLASGPAIKIKIDRKNIENIVGIINNASVGAIRKYDKYDKLRDFSNVCAELKNFTLLTGHFDNAASKVIFSYDNEKIELAEKAGLVLTKN